MRFLELGCDVFVLQAELGMGRGRQKQKKRRVPLGDKRKIQCAGFTPGRRCSGRSRAPAHDFPPFPKTRPPLSGFGLVLETEGVYTKYLGKPNSPGLGVRLRGAVQALLFEGAPLEARLCEHAHAWLWMKSHQWAFFWSCLAMASFALGAGLSHFFCLSWLPCPPCTLDASRQCLPLPAALPWLCLCCQRKGRAQELAGSILPVAMDGCCPCTWEGSRCLLETLWCLGGGKVLIWHLQVQALRRLARGRALTPFVVWVPRVTPTLLLPLRSPSVTPSLWISPGATSMGWTCGCPFWLPQHAVQGVALTRSGILVFHAHKPGHLGKVFARTQSGKTSSWASHQPSVPLSAHVCAKACIRGWAITLPTAGLPASAESQDEVLAFVFSNIYSGAQVWLGAFALKAEEWG